MLGLTRPGIGFSFLSSKARLAAQGYTRAHGPEGVVIQADIGGEPDARGSKGKAASEVEDLEAQQRKAAWKRKREQIPSAEDAEFWSKFKVSLLVLISIVLR